MFGLIPFFRSTIGKKVLMAVSGVFLFAFCVEHVTGALLFFKGHTPSTGTAACCTTRCLVWSFRVGLILAAVVHVTFATLLYFQELAARPVGYATVATCGRAMRPHDEVLGAILARLCDLSPAHLTWGYNVVPGRFIEGDIYANMLNGFRTGWVALVYVAAVSLLGCTCCMARTAVRSLGCATVG